ncbi:MAG: hypothetical protein COA96_08880 [SAR86 cluster bacterium]|uniref:Uncharacterized protein n=1 Tax=SAR86 cluster bacterium TaxID=2030880 RepID=A0A2A5B086_9GAMM|nr:MAG: hypothetical protein COA96_08880 [SAR86 cluster bacterium]
MLPILPDTLTFVESLASFDLIDAKQSITGGSSTVIAIQYNYGKLMMPGVISLRAGISRS